jgi:hypothetical protein
MKNESEQNIIITAGAGDIDQLLPTLKNIIR